MNDMPITDRKASVKKPGSNKAKHYCTEIEAAAALGVPAATLAKDRRAFEQVVPFTNFAQRGPMYRQTVLDGITGDPEKLMMVRRKLTGASQ